MLKPFIFAFVLCLFSINMKSMCPEYAFVLSLVGGVILAIYALGKFRDILSTIKELRDTLHFANSYFILVFKVLGISFLCEFAVNICKDAKEQTLAQQVELAGKLSILLMGLPLLKEILLTMNRLLR